MSSAFPFVRADIYIGINTFTGINQVIAVKCHKISKNVEKMSDKCYSKNKNLPQGLFKKEFQWHEKINREVDRRRSGVKVECL